MPTDKWAVVLRGGVQTATETNVPVVLSSTNRRTLDQRPRPFEVDVGTADSFDTDSVIDCRWVYTLLKKDLTPATFLFYVSDQIMEVISVALVSGLQMFPPPPASPPLFELETGP